MIALVTGSFTGCVANKNIYHWGDYEEVVYESLNGTEGGSQESRVESLEITIEKAIEKDKKVPPGLYAQLGYHFFQCGQLEKAANAFTTEIGRAHV